MEEIIAQNAEIAALLPEMTAQLELIYRRANNWLTFASVCGWIAFGFAVIGAIWLFIKVRKEKNYNKGEE